MEIIYAKTMNPEFYDYRMFDIREDDGNEVLIDGGSEFSDVDKNGELASIKRFITEFSEYDLEVYYSNSIKEYIKDMLPAKDNKKDFSPKELQVILQAIESDGYDKRRYDSNYMYNAITTILSIIHCKQYACRQLRGCMQREWVEAFYPEDTSEEYLYWVEAWYFGTGTEVMIHDSEDKVSGAEDVSGYCVYLTGWNDKMLKEQIRESCGYKGNNKSVKVVLWKWDGYTRTDKYELADD